MTHKLINLNLLFAIAFSIITVSCTDESLFSRQRFGNQEYEKICNVNYQHCMNVYNSLIDTFKEPTTRAEIDSVTFPDYYGGAYIDNSHQKLIIHIKSNYVNAYPLSITPLLNDTCVEIIDCQYSYNELQKQKRDIVAYMRKFEKNPIVNNIAICGTDVRSNKVIVHLLECNESRINEFKEHVSNSPMIHFTQAQFCNTGKNVAPGDPLQSAFPGSVGYACACDGVQGFITAGHVTGLHMAVSVRNHKVGICKKVQTSGDIDAAFIETAPGVHPTNVFGRWTFYSTLYKSEIVIGMLVHIFSTYIKGSMTQVTNTDLAVNHQDPLRGEYGPIIDGCVELNGQVSHGDSGGVVFTEDNRLLGIIKGIGWGHTYCVTAVAINGAFGTIIL